VAEQASLMKNAWTIRPIHEWQTMLNELMLWFKSRDRVLSQTELASLTSAYRQAQMGMCGNVHILFTVIKDRLPCNRLSQAIKHGYTIMNLQANVKPWSGNICHCPNN